MLTQNKILEKQAQIHPSKLMKYDWLVSIQFLQSISDDKVITNLQYLL